MKRILNHGLMDGIGKNEVVAHIKSRYNIQPSTENKLSSKVEKEKSEFSPVSLDNLSTSIPTFLVLILICGIVLMIEKYLVCKIFCTKNCVKKRETPPPAKNHQNSSSHGKV